MSTNDRIDIPGAFQSLIDTIPKTGVDLSIILAGLHILQCVVTDLRRIADASETLTASGKSISDKIDIVRTRG